MEGARPLSPFLFISTQVLGKKNWPNSSFSHHYWSLRPLGNSGSATVSALANIEEGVVPGTPPLGPISFVFMQFSGEKTGRSISNTFFKIPSDNNIKILDYATSYIYIIKNSPRFCFIAVHWNFILVHYISQ